MPVPLTESVSVMIINYGVPFPMLCSQKSFPHISFFFSLLIFTQPYNFKYHLYGVGSHIYNSIPNLCFELQMAYLVPFKCLSGIINSMKTILNSFFPPLNMLLFRTSSSQQMSLILTLLFILITLISSFISLFLFYSTFNRWRKRSGSTSNISQTHLLTFFLVTISVQVIILSFLDY